MKTVILNSNTVFKDMKYKRWKQRIEANGNIIKDIELLSGISRDGINLFAAFLDCRLLTPEGNEIPRCVVIGGDSVVIVPVLTCYEDREIYTMMVEQRRIVDGDFNKEFPAGSTVNEEDPKTIACQELKEELHLNVSPEELIPLTTDLVKMNPSVLDARVHFFYFERQVSRSFLEEMDGCHTGCFKDHEYINVRVHKMAEVANILTPSAIIGVKLVEQALNRVF